MEFINFLLEITGIALPAALMFAFQSHFPLAKLGPPLLPRPIPDEQQTLVLCAIPSIMYLIGRVYFAMVFKITSKIFPKKDDENTSYSIVQTIVGKLESPVTYGLVLFIFIVPFFHPLIQSFLMDYYQTNYAQIVNVLYDMSKPDIDKSWAFGKKFAALLVGWFALLFCVELVLRIILLILRALYRAIFGSSTTDAVAVEGGAVVEDGKKVKSE